MHWSSPGELADSGYRGAVLSALSRSLDIDPLPDERLERAAMVQRERNHHWLARFYVQRMSRSPIDAGLRSYTD